MFKASAPGSLMILGEHAVLHGSFALVTAINYRMHVSLKPRKDTTIKIISAMGEFTCDLKKIIVTQPFDYLLTIFKKYQSEFPSGFELEVHADFSYQIGFGSSSAVTVATLRVIHEWLDLSLNDRDLIICGREIVREVQVVGSGADIAASVLGGVVIYRAEPFFAEKISYDYPLTVVYSGGKTKTQEVIRYVNEQFKNSKSLYNEIIRGISQCADAGILAAKKHAHQELGKIMSQQQVLMEDLKVNTTYLQNVIDIIKKDTHILGTKISGSGLGDCAIGLGEAQVLSLPEFIFPEKKVGPIKRYPCQIDSRGVCLEEN